MGSREGNRALRGGQEPLRVAFFAMFPEDHVATWTFCRWPVDHGGPLGIDGRLFAPSGPGLHARMNARGARFRGVRMAVYWYLIVLPRRLGQLWRARRCDVALVQRGLLHPKSRPLLESLLARFGPPIVYHLDDALWVLKPRGYRRRITLARCVITGSEVVSSYARALGADVVTVEYPVAAERYPVREHVARDHPVIGWTGSRPEDYLPPALPSVIEACRRTGARLKVVSGETRPELGSADQLLDWEPWTEARRFDALADVDVGILPLTDCELHRAKEPFKLKEYMAHGLPVVASPVGHVPSVMTDGREGFFATTERDWSDRLTELLEDAQLRARMGAAGRTLVVEGYGFGDQMRGLAAALRSAARAST